MDSAELAHLVSRLDDGVRETAGRFRVQMGMVALLFGALAALFGWSGSWGACALAGAFAVGVFLLGYAAAKKTAPEKMQPVVDAVRNQPEAIVSVRHYETSNSTRVFVTQWIEVKTAGHRLIVKAPDHEKLFALLQQRCPHAKFTGL